MKKHIIGTDGKLVKTIEGIPECGDYCDTCGDCLKCYGEDACGAEEGKEHLWVEYLEE